MAATLSALLKRSSLTDPEEILAACDAALQSTKTDTHAQHARVVALLKLDRFDDALRTFDAAGDQLRQLAAFEYSYALYKTGRLDDAIAAARRLSATHRGAAHVEAQASYRAERFARSAQLYEQLQAGPESEAVDLRVNATAVDAQVQFAAPGAAAPAAPAASRADLEAFETTYNLATAAAARGELSKAGVLLRRAEELCRSSGELTPGEIEAELLPIQVQQLYVATLSGNQAEAERLMSEIDTAKIIEPSTRQIGVNNLLVSQSSTMSPYMLFKAFHETPKPEDSDRLFSYQRHIALANSGVIDLLAHKTDGLARTTGASVRAACTASADVNTLSTLNLAAVIRRARAARPDGVGEPSYREEATKLLRQRPTDVGLLLTVVQLNVAEGRLANALNVLKQALAQLDAASTSDSDKSVRYCPGLVSVYVALCKRLGQPVQAQAELKQAARYWQSQETSTDRAAASLLRGAGMSLVESHRSQDDVDMAVDIFAPLKERDPSDRLSVAGYIAAAALSGHDDLAAEAQSLTAVSQLIADVDIDALEDGGVATIPAEWQAKETVAKRSVLETEDQPQDGTATEAPSKRRRLRKSRMPKDFDPNKQPDPERWLPLRDRSSYRPPKGRKAKQRAAERTQGGFAAEGESASATSSGLGVAVTKTKSSGAGGKKKKGKGKK